MNARYNLATISRGLNIFSKMSENHCNAKSHSRLARIDTRQLFALSEDAFFFRAGIGVLFDIANVRQVYFINAEAKKGGLDDEFRDDGAEVEHLEPAAFQN